LQGDEWAKDDGGDDEGDEGDADESPEVGEALLEEGSEAGGCGGEVAEEGSGDEQEVDEEVEGNAGGVDGDTAGWLAQVNEGFSDGAEVEAGAEALGGEGVGREIGQLAVEAQREDDGEAKVEGVDPEECREAAEGDAEAVGEEVARVGHGMCASWCWCAG
jgi:hypothetical protein